ncbi:hypothetical protein J5N97_027253 [Dioscorea zingiberensis]|uniref:COBRA C-terminal domain-containing protein n=1 Tax=Dioscorea zingiberensis TaxID=325984 RepID=A0A9D5C4H4_9LILI|nr:hypothetical protein J5N97_027253 [Dioscorea zingiberensis]
MQRLGALLFVAVLIAGAAAQDYDDGAQEAPPPPALDNCDGVFLTYTFISRAKEFPHVKNSSAQAYAFKSMATILNAMDTDLKAWKMFIGFQHDEILVSAGGAVVTEGSDLPAKVGNGTSLSGFPQTDLLNSIDTAGDMNQIQVRIDLTGTQFGVKPPAVPMPKTIKLLNDGFKCPTPTKKGSIMYVCCIKDPKFKKMKDTNKFLPRQYGDLNMVYDILQAYDNNYLAQVTIDNNSPIGRLDNWNLTWEWMRNEFIFSMKGAYTHKKDPADCIYGAAGQYYQNFDFSQVMNCEKHPVIADLPPEMENDDRVGKLPFCCKNGTLLPPTMNATKSHAIFQLQVYKMPPDLNRTALYPPQNWKINGVLNPDYTCGPPVRVIPSEFPDPSGLMSNSYAIASWQVVCNITRPKAKTSRCCVSFSAFYNDSVIPCNTCACGCADDSGCNPDEAPLLLPSEALLVPFDNRTAKAKAWAKLRHMKLPNTLPCPDNCGVSINWHVASDYSKGWTARITLFNWEDYTFKDWFAAVELGKAFNGYQRVYSFNGTKLSQLENTLFFEGLPGLNYLMPLSDGKDPKSDPKLPGKQQSVISFSKKRTPGIDVLGGDGFPTRVYFNGEECSLPDEIPRGHGHRSPVVLLQLVLASVLVFVFIA